MWQTVKNGSKLPDFVRKRAPCSGLSGTEWSVLRKTLQYGLKAPESDTHTARVAKHKVGIGSAWAQGMARSAHTAHAGVWCGAEKGCKADLSKKMSKF